MSFIFNSYVNRIYSYVIHMSFLRARILSVGTRCHPYFTHTYLYAICMSLIYIRMSSVCHSYVIRISLVYSYLIRISLACTSMSPVCTCMSSASIRMSPVRHSYILLCHPYVTRIYSYVILMSLVCDFTMNPNYRTVSDLSLASKNFERFMRKQTNKHIKNYVSPYFSGYRKDYSTQHVLYFHLRKVEQKYLKALAGQF